MYSKLNLFNIDKMLELEELLNGNEAFTLMFTHCNGNADAYPFKGVNDKFVNARIILKNSGEYRFPKFRNIDSFKISNDGEVVCKHAYAYQIQTFEGLVGVRKNYPELDDAEIDELASMFALFHSADKIKIFNWIKKSIEELDKKFKLISTNIAEINNQMLYDAAQQDHMLDTECMVLSIDKKDAAAKIVKKADVKIR